jgi:hypothetical protein
MHVRCGGGVPVGYRWGVSFRVDLTVLTYGVRAGDGVRLRENLHSGSLGLQAMARGCWLAVAKQRGQPRLFSRGPLQEKCSVDRLEYRYLVFVISQSFSLMHRWNLHIVNEGLLSFPEPRPLDN